MIITELVMPAMPERSKARANSNPRTAVAYSPSVALNQTLRSKAAGSSPCRANA